MTFGAARDGLAAAAPHFSSVVDRAGTSGNQKPLDIVDRFGGISVIAPNPLYSKRMAVYTIHFYNHGGNVRPAYHIERLTDESAIAEADRLNVLPHIFSGFDVWDGDRLVHQHCNNPTRDVSASASSDGRSSNRTTQQ